MSHFFAYLSRMRFIRRWNIMRNTQSENIQEHSLQVSMVAHALCRIKNRYYDGRVDEGKVLALAVYHEAPEVITGDLSTPIKYFNPEIKHAYKKVEQIAASTLLAMLPDDLQAEYQPLLLPDETSEEWQIVKAADRICAYLKCVEEMKAGNMEFEKAQANIRSSIDRLGRPEVSYFMEKFAPSFSLSLDELN
ncbi:MAG: 5'-deoxynucleotidase [Christensenellales bacterium]|jgi:5'-deoxynucleotidase